ASASNISLSGGTLTANSSCTFTVEVAGATGGAKHNAIDAVTSAEGGTGNAAAADVVVIEPPAIAMSFGAPSIPLNGTTSLNFTITNPSINDVPLTSVAFSDS